MAEKYIAKDGTASWREVVFLGRDENGKRVRRLVTRPTKRDLDVEARRLKSLKDGGARVAPSKLTLGAYLRHWLEMKVKAEIEGRTQWDYEGNLDRYILKPRHPNAPPIAQVRLDKLGPEAFEELFRWMRDDCKLSHRTTEYVRAIVGQALGHAVNKGLIAKNPTKGVKVPPRRSGDDWEEEEAQERDASRALDAAGAQAFLEAAREDDYPALWVLLLANGLRPSEALGLKWTDASSDLRTLTIRRSLRRNGVKGGGWKPRPTKNKRARTIELPPTASAALREWQSRQRELRRRASEWETHGFIFTNEHGKPLHAGNLSRRNFRDICARAGLGEWGPIRFKPKGKRGPPKKRPFMPSLRMYDLRHTCATLHLLGATTPQMWKAVSEMLGHAKVSFTMDVYAHVVPAMRESAAAVMEAVIGGGSCGTDVGQNSRTASNEGQSGAL